MTLMYELVKKAYEIGRGRGVSLAQGYSVSKDGTTVFALNPNSPDGVYITVDGVVAFGEPNPDFILFDMSEALDSMSVA